MEQYAFRAFADALESVPMALAENSGFAPIEALADLKAKQIAQKNPRLGIDCVSAGTNGSSFASGGPFIIYDSSFMLHSFTFSPPPPYRSHD